MQAGYLQVQPQVDSSARACACPLGYVVAAFTSNLTDHVTVWEVYGTKPPLGCAPFRCPLSSVRKTSIFSGAKTSFLAQLLSYPCEFANVLSMDQRGECRGCSGRLGQMLMSAISRWHAVCLTGAAD